jgi:hypothetical protein
MLGNARIDTCLQLDHLNLARMNGGIDGWNT